MKDEGRRILERRIMDTQRLSTEAIFVVQIVAYGVSTIQPIIVLCQVRHLEFSFLVINNPDAFGSKYR